MELLRYWRAIRKSLWLVLLIVITGTASTAIYSINQPTEYESSATLILNPSVPSSLVPYVQNEVAASLADSYSALVGTRTFAESVAKELPFSIDPDLVGQAVTTQLTSNTLFYRISARMPEPQQAQQLAATVAHVILTANAAQQTPSTPADDDKELMRGRLKTKLADLTDQIATYQTQLDRLNAEPPSTSRDDQLVQLRSQLLSLQDSETNTVLAIAQLASNEPAPTNTAIIMDPARPGVAVPSKWISKVAISLVVSLILGLGIAFMIDYLDYTVHSPEEVEEFLSLAPVGAVGLVAPGSERKRRRRKGQPATKADPGVQRLVTIGQMHSPQAESFRILRTNIQFSSLHKQIRSLVVTSAGVGEGKSFTSANLAIAMAQAGQRVLLVDADLRRPTLHKLFRLPNNQGFTSLMIDATSIEPHALQTLPGVDNLRILTSGPLPPNPSELLSSPLAAEVMAQFARHADVVIYDSPPAAAVADPAILAARCDAVLLVISAGATRRDMARRVVRSLKSSGVGLVLPLLNKVKTRDLAGYYYYHYYSADFAPNGKANGKANGNGKHNGSGPSATELTRDTVALYSDSGDSKN